MDEWIVECRVPEGYYCYVGHLIDWWWLFGAILFLIVGLILAVRWLS